MQRKLLPEAAQYAKQNRYRSIWRKFVRVMACVVVFCTTYALILPAITMEKAMLCGLEEHVHSEECYAQVTTKQVATLSCTYESLGIHTHTEECYGTYDVPQCGYADLLVHEHEESCVDETGALICPLGELKAHEHSEECYSVQETEAVKVHTHEDSCYTTERGELICTTEETAGHTHEDSCYIQGENLTCTLEEKEGHTHGEGCTETVLICTASTEPAHTHDPAECYQLQLICTLPEDENHTHSVDCIEAEVTCGLSTEGHVHDADTCYQTNVICQLEESEGHTHDAGCYEKVLDCSVPEAEAHQHSDSCYAQNKVLICPLTEGEPEQTQSADPAAPTEPVLICEEEEVILHTHADDCYTKYTDEAGTEYEVLTCTKPEVLEHSHSASVCIGTAEVPLENEDELTCQLEESEGHTHSDDCLNEAGETVCGLEESAGHTHGKLCYGTWELVCALEEHTHTEECVAELTEEELAQVEYVIQLIDEMPSADEIDAKIEAFEEAEDYEGEEAWYAEVCQQVAEAYYYYDQLTDVQKACVTNADKLMELEPIWSATEYSANSGTTPVDTAPVHAVNSFGTLGSGFYSILIHGGSYDEVMADTIDAGWTFQYWVAIVVSTDSNGNLYVENYVNDSSDKSTLKPSHTEKGFVLLANNASSYFDFVSKYNAGTKIYASVNFDYTSTGAVYNATGYGTISFDTNVFVKKTATVSDEPTPIQSAHTSEFIELNLYDYGSNINTNFNNNKYSYTDWNYATKYTSYYPGFQWNGGAYVKADLVDSTSGTADRNHIDSIDFGNSLITDLQYSGSSHAKSTTATDITFFADSGTYSINAMDYYYKTIDGTQNCYVYGVNNRPIGLSIGSSITDTSYDVLERTLGSDGYPQIKANDASLAYLFTNNTYATKKNTTSIDGLFLQDSTTGEYYFNSRWNHAQYSDNEFTLYDNIITPNFITYPFGNFMPFNDITDSEDATQVSKITSMGNYMDYMLDQLYPYTLTNYAAGFDSSRNQLYYMLNQYKSNVKYYGIHSKTWSTFSASDAIWDYFTGGGENEGDSPTNDTGFLTNDHLSAMYNIDYDVEKNFFFGMEMKMNFYQPKDGMTGNDNDCNGMPDYPMEFYFTGDDDVWVYIDNVLFLDLTGIHRHVGGKIDFVNGKVYYYPLTISSGDVSSTPYATYTFKEILEAAGASTADLNDEGTFKDYTTHSFNFYYTERGSGSSVCRLNFNFPLLRQNSLAVEKELADDDSTEAVEALGNPDFLFQVLDADADDNSLFIPEGWAYSLYDTDGSVIQGLEVTEKYQDGRVKTLKIKDGSENVLCTEEYDSNGNMTSRTGDGQDKVLRTGENGIFALKAGQKAEFVGIPETWGKYYVRELLEGTVAEQYGTITVSGTAVTPETLTVGGVSYSGANSPVLDMSNGSSVFRVENKIDTSKLGALTITKTVENTYSGTTPNTPFEFLVTMDGEPLPVGTKYYDGTEAEGAEPNGTVTTEGIVSITADQKVTIPNILAGTKFEVTETETSAKGYNVTYTVDGTAQTDATSATGTVKLVGSTAEDGTVTYAPSTVAVTVENKEIGVKLSIPVTKKYYKHGSTERMSTFKLVQVTDEKGTVVVEATNISSKDGGKVTVNDKPVTVDPLFTLSYLDTDNITYDESGQAKFYYRLTEDNTKRPNATLKNYQVYVYEVTVTKSGEGMTAEITGMWTGTAEEDGTPTGTLTKLDSPTTATFKNTIVGPLTLSKKVEGSQVSKGKGYEFKIVLNTENAGYAPLPDSLTVTITKTVDNTTSEREVTLTLTPINGVETRRSCTITLYNGESVTLENIPYNTSWSITEQSVPSGMQVTYEIFNGSTSKETKTGTSATGKILVGSTNAVSVAFTNTQLYELPQTGGTGTHVYTMAGLMLMLLSAAYLLYRSTKRRREAV